MGGGASSEQQAARRAVDGTQALHTRRAARQQTLADSSEPQNQEQSRRASQVSSRPAWPQPSRPPKHAGKQASTQARTPASGRAASGRALCLTLYLHARATRLPALACSKPRANADRRLERLVTSARAQSTRPPNSTQRRGQLALPVRLVCSTWLPGLLGEHRLRAWALLRLARKAAVEQPMHRKTPSLPPSPSHWHPVSLLPSCLCLSLPHTPPSPPPPTLTWL